VFKRFLDGGTLEECYAAVANVANEMLDIIDERGQNMEDEALLNIISESSTMSRALLDYGAQKSCAITTAKRLGEVLGEDTVRDKGLACRYIVSKLPEENIHDGQGDFPGVFEALAQRQQPEGRRCRHSQCS